MSTDGTGGPDGAATTRIGDPVGTEYLLGLREALSDLPPAEVEEIVEDARGHLADLSDELGPGFDRAAVRERLGTPEAYAAELRAAAGYPAPQASAERPRTGGAWFAVIALLGATGLMALAGLAVWQVGPSAALPMFLAALAAGAGALAVWSDGPGQPSVAALPSVVALRERIARTRDDGGVGAFVLTLQPGWWVLRGLVAAGFVGWVFGGGGSAGLLITVVLAVAAVPLSVLLGRRSAADRRLLWAVVPLNALAAGLLVAGVLAQGQDRDTDVSSYTPPPGLTLDGNTVSDVRPFDAKGRPLTGVYLFDENGRPLAVDDGYCPTDGSAATSTAPAPGPYPQGVRTTDPSSGECVTVPPPPLVVTIPQTTAARPSTQAPTTAPQATPAPATPGAGG
ncbi:hypothetical protein DMP17_18220 [Pseudonocardia sp. TMWB2A]|uniref:HAAS signaling domain-containing protein n=1 Tax=Pseudonocardia sp. TMWB2A TaxID=687430 RepID=UPI00307CFC24